MGAIVLAAYGSTGPVIAQTAAFVDIPSRGAGVPVGYDDMLKTAIVDELAAIGLRDIDKARFDKAQYSYLLQVKADLYSEATRVAVKMFATANDFELFSYPFWLPALSQDSPVQRVIKDGPLLRKKFSGMITHLYTIYRQGDNRPKLFADCIFPPENPAAVDWQFSQFLTTNYPVALQRDNSLRQYRVFGIQPSAFVEWCKSANPDEPVSMAAFEAKVSGQTYKLPDGDSLLLSFQVGEGAPVLRVISVSKNWDDVSGRIAAAVTGIISER